MENVVSKSTQPKFLMVILYRNIQKILFTQSTTRLDCSKVNLTFYSKYNNEEQSNNDKCVLKC